MYVVKAMLTSSDVVEIATHPTSLLYIEIHCKLMVHHHFGQRLASVWWRTPGVAAITCSLSIPALVSYLDTSTTPLCHNVYPAQFRATSASADHL